MNYSISLAKKQRRQLRWQIAGEKIGEWYHHLLPVAWMLFGVLIGINHKSEVKQKWQKNG